MSDTTLIGVSRPRVDAPDKVTGATRFAADGYVHGLLHARPVLATEAHARIRGVDKDAALATPGVVAVLLAADLPIASTGTDRTAEPLAREEVIFAGQPVAMVDSGVDRLQVACLVVSLLDGARERGADLHGGLDVDDRFEWLVVDDDRLRAVLRGCLGLADDERHRLS